MIRRLRRCAVLLLCATTMLPAQETAKAARVRVSGVEREVRYDSPDEVSCQGPQQPSNGKQRNGKLVALGLGLIGGGVALMVANPEVSSGPTVLSGNGNLYQQRYHMRLIGGAIAGGGAVVLIQGLRGR